MPLDNTRASANFVNLECGTNVHYIPRCIEAICLDTRIGPGTPELPSEVGWYARPRV